MSKSNNLNISIEILDRKIRMQAYFVFAQEDPHGNAREFVFAVEDPAMAAEARRILANPNSTKRQVSGIIVPTQAWYNPHWSFHLDPSSVNFFELAAEVCDANVAWVEENLLHLGGSALPGMHWCPWSSKIQREVFP